LIQQNWKFLQDEFGGKIITTSSVYSTSGAILAAYAYRLKLNAILAVGGTKPDTIDKHHMMRLAKAYGCDVRIVCGTGMAGPLKKRLTEICDTEKVFNAVFSDSVEGDQGAILDPISAQVVNLPDDLDNLVVPVGTGIHLLAIMRGLEQHGKTVKRIIGCHVGPDRRKKIDGYLSPLEWQNPTYDMVALNLKTAYAKACVEHMPDGDPLDEIYEAKTHVWMRENLDLKNEKTLLWIVGRRPSVEETDAQIEQLTETVTS
jgi:1-aminocyclopropane-1-carboxylate deaminase/D-cysteine desulfhydrase-like pyridoxal-dependent ACC family enzyme